MGWGTQAEFLNMQLIESIDPLFGVHATGMFESVFDVAYVFPVSRSSQDFRLMFSVTLSIVRIQLVYVARLLPQRSIISIGK